MSERGNTTHERLAWWRDHMPSVSLDLVTGGAYRAGRLVAVDHPALVAALAALLDAGSPEAKYLAEIMEARHADSSRNHNGKAGPGSGADS